MDIYKLKSDEIQYLTFFIETTELAKMGFDYDISYDEGKSKLGWWQTPNATFYEGEDYNNKALMVPDITVYSGNLILNDAAYNKLVDVLSPYGEFLPVLSESIPYHLFHIQSTVDDSCIDRDNSEQFIDNGIYMGLNKLNFHKNKISDNELLFRTSYDQFAEVYCTEAFKNKIEALDLKGLYFETELALY